MSYISRAESAVERGQAMRAFFVLVNGLRRDPSDERGLNMLVELYIREFDSPGVEADLLSVLDLVPDGLDIYEMIHASLEQSGDERRLKSLIQIRERDGRLQHFETLEAVSPAAAHTPSYTAAPAQPARSASTRHNSGRQSSLAPARPAYGGHDSHHEHHSGPHEHFEAHPQHHGGAHEHFDAQQRYDAASAYHAHTHQEGHTHANDTSLQGWDTPTPPQSPARAQSEVVAHASYLREDAPSDSQETATTGVFSSINVYLAEQEAQLAEELAQRSKRRLLVIGIVVLAAVLILAFILRPSGADENSDEASDATTAIEITAPIAEPIAD